MKERRETYEVEFALAEISTGAAFLSFPPLMAAQAPNPVIPYTPKAMYSLRIFLPAIVLHKRVRRSVICVVQLDVGNMQGSAGRGSVR